MNLRAAYAHRFQTANFAFAPPLKAGSHHPGPWMSFPLGGGGDILAELVVPDALAETQGERQLIAMTIVTLLRLWCDPDIEVAFESLVATAELAAKGKSGDLRVIQSRSRPVRFAVDRSDSLHFSSSSASWVADHWSAAVRLRMRSPEFSLLLDTFETAQIMPSKAMMLVSMWGALEAVFTAEKSELRFRVSCNVAAYLEEAGDERAALQKKVLKLYDARSAAAHGSNKFSDEALLATVDLYRRVLFRIIESGSLPDKGFLERRLFGG
ncbi:hypothetical protein IB227_04880 [Stenotrophomonas sp. STM01]|uniref:HEPN domain-containing protein n=1 Tax=Stenotrophomonas sp. STM01 TaxID=2769278 RepID=UPI001783E5FC|nr:HEPN domain-containing protein [Stenotrophomonas sp. STM01]MBD9535187.1 hypothetical protein [Stenotrophomonas sp. STM01]